MAFSLRSRSLEKKKERPPSRGAKLAAARGELREGFPFYPLTSPLLLLLLLRLLLLLLLFLLLLVAAARARAQGKGTLSPRRSPVVGCRPRSSQRLIHSV